MSDNQTPETPPPKMERSIAQVLRAAAENPQQVEALRRALLALVKAPSQPAARAGLLQVAREIEKITGDQS